MAWFHATVIAYATDFDSSIGLTATCFRCMKGAAEPDIDRDDTKPGFARCKVQGQISCWDLAERGEYHR